MTETHFRHAAVKAFDRAGFMVSVIEPGPGSTPGIPDLVLSRGSIDLWIELKVTTKQLTALQVWQRLLRPSQRRWIWSRLQISDPQIPSISLYVIVGSPFGLDLYSAIAENKSENRVAELVLSAHGNNISALAELLRKDVDFRTKI